MKSPTWWWVWGMQTVNKQHYHHQFYLLIACTLVSLLLQLMLLAIVAHSPFFTIQGLLNLQSNPTCLWPLPFLFWFLTLISGYCFLQFTGHALQTLSFHWLNSGKLYLGLKSQLVWDLEWCLRQKSLENAGHILSSESSYIFNYAGIGNASARITIMNFNQLLNSLSNPI